jgi:endo-1,4-beta-xylanase
MDPYKAGLPDEIQQRLAKRYADIFDIYLRHGQSINRVTFWGLGDGQSWLNSFPIRGRTNYPLLFDRELKPKPAFQAVGPERQRTQIPLIQNIHH